MSQVLKVVAMLKASLDCDVYTGEIPESQSAPAVLVTDLANIYNRTISGRKVRKLSTWRLTIVARTPALVETILEQLEAIDNTKTLDFQRIFTNLVMTEYGQNEQPFKRAFYDMTIY